MFVSDEIKFTKIYRVLWFIHGRWLVYIDPSTQYKPDRTAAVNGDDVGNGEQFDSDEMII